MNKKILGMNPKEKKEKLAIITAFMTYSLENDHYPKSVYKFCKENEMEEKTFYKFFGSLDGIKETIWESFYQNAMTLLQKDENFEMAKPKEESNFSKTTKLVQTRLKSLSVSMGAYKVTILYYNLNCWEI